MAQEPIKSEEVVLTEEMGSVRLITLNRPQQLNVISSKVVSIIAESLEKWEGEDDAKLIVIKGRGRAFSAGGDLKMFYTEGKTDVSCTEAVYRMYWLLHHIHTYSKTMVALVHGIVMGGGASLSVPLKYSVVTEKTVFSVPEASVGFHTDCSFSYILSHIPGHLGEYLALTGARLDGKEMLSAGLATHFVPSVKMVELEKRLLSLDTGDERAVSSAIEEFSVSVELDEKSILNKKKIIDKCFSQGSVEEIISALETEARVEGNEWATEVVKGLKRSSPTGLKITLRSVREGREQSLAECLKKEFRLTMNILKTVICNDMYEGIRALVIDKDKAPKWDPPTLDKVSIEKLDLVFEPFKDELELQIPLNGKLPRWGGNFESSIYHAGKH